MIYTIVTDGVIDIGSVIANTITDQANDSVGALLFLCLITKLYKNAGVSTIRNIPIKPAPLIDVINIARYCEEGTLQYHHRQQQKQMGPLTTNQQLDRMERTKKHIVQSLYGIESMIHQLVELYHFDFASLGGLLAPPKDDDDEDGRGEEGKE